MTSVHACLKACGNIMNIVLRGVWFPLEVEPKPSQKATPTYTYIQPHTLQHTQANPGMRDSCAQTRSHTRTRTPRIHARTHALIHSPIHTRIHTCIHTYIHMYIYTYVHTYIFVSTRERRQVVRRAAVPVGDAAYRDRHEWRLVTRRTADRVLMAACSVSTVAHNEEG
jgi:hypothetical protein